MPSFQLILEKTNGYESEDELNRFYKKFEARLKTVSQDRVSRQDIPFELRRIDSLARLLETNLICAAVYLDNEELLLASNKIHSGSLKNSKKTKTMESVVNLVRNENLNIEEIFDQLSHVIYLNILQEKRYSLKILNETGFDLLPTIRNWLVDMFHFNGTTKEWCEFTIKNFVYTDNKTVNIIKSLIHKTSRLARDFLKLRDFLLKAKKNNPTSLSLLTAIREGRFKILYTENQNVHAEMRLLSEIIAQNKERSYTAISKLCCGHCALAMDALNMKSRGKHGQSSEWPIPNFIFNNAERLEEYLGNDTYQIYRRLNKLQQKTALTFISSKESNPIKENAKHGRVMTADSSDSDVEFGLSYSDDDKTVEIKKFPLNKIWKFRHLLINYSVEFQRLEEFNLDLNEIIELFESSKEKFLALTDKNTYDLIIRLYESESNLDIFEKISSLYEDKPLLFWSIVKDGGEFIMEYGFEEVCETYNRIEERHKYNFDSEPDDSYFDDDIFTEQPDIYQLVIEELKKDNTNEFSSDPYKSDGSSSDNEAIFNDFDEQNSYSSVF